jgi:hypothetical protein
MHREIPLTHRGEVITHALVDADDYERLAPFPWHLSSNGYARRHEPKGTHHSEGQRVIYMHREVMGLGYVPYDGRQIDHLNKNKLDNRKANLEVVHYRKNLARRRGNTFGVFFKSHDQLWLVRYGQATLAYFHTFEEATDARAEVADIVARWRGINANATTGHPAKNSAPRPEGQRALKARPAREGNEARDREVSKESNA